MLYVSAYVIARKPRVRSISHRVWSSPLKRSSPPHLHIITKVLFYNSIDFDPQQRSIHQNDRFQQKLDFAFCLTLRLVSLYKLCIATAPPKKKNNNDRTVSIYIQQRNRCSCDFGCVLVFQWVLIFRFSVCMLRSQTATKIRTTQKIVSDVFFCKFCASIFWFYHSSVPS